MKLISFTKKKAVALGLAFGVAAGAGGIAAAFFTASGSGAGTATVANVTNITFKTITVSLSAKNLTTPVAVAFHTTNPNSGTVKVTKYVGVTKVTTTGSCPAGSFTAITSAKPLGAVSAGTNPASSTAEPMIKLVTVASTPQTGCTGTITISLTTVSTQSTVYSAVPIT